MKDPIVEEIRKLRKEHTDRFHGDLHLICEDLRKLEAALPNPVLSEPLKPQKSGSNKTLREPEKK